MRTGRVAGVNRYPVIVVQAVAIPRCVVPQLGESRQLLDVLLGHLFQTPDGGFGIDVGEEGDRVLDVGTGCGIIPLLLSQRVASLKVTAIEIQQSLYDMAAKNLFRNSHDENIRLVLGDFLKIAPTWSAGSFDWILSNPPYRKMRSGRINPNQEKAIARHELTLTLHGLIDASHRLLKPEGKIALVYPWHRLSEVRRQLETQNFNPCRIRHVFGQPRTEARFFLITAGKGTSTREPTEEFFNMVHADGSHTIQMQEIYASYNYCGRSHGIREK